MYSGTNPKALNSQRLLADALVSLIKEKDLLNEKFKSKEGKSYLRSGFITSHIALEIYDDKTDKYFDVSITVVKEHQLAFAIYKDITQETLQEEKMRLLREEMVEVTDKVINKQMAAVQEIASLLGETAAETKIALSKLKESIQDE